MTRSVLKKRIMCFMCFFASLFISVYFTGCVNNTNKNPVVSISIDPDNKNIDTDGKPISGTFEIELFPEKAPNSVAYFLEFVSQGIYDGFPVSKVMAGGIVQFGDPWMIKQIRTEIKGEFKENGFERNDVQFKRGTVALARFLNDDYNSASGDFFILLDDSGADTYQDKYAAIGEIISGIEVLDKISMVKDYTDASPIYSIKTLKAAANLKGRTYEKPITDKRRTYPGINLEE